MHLPRQNGKTRTHLKIAITQLRFAARIPQIQVLRVTITQNCCASDKEMCVNSKLTFGTAVQAFQIFTIRKSNFFPIQYQPTSGLHVNSHFGHVFSRIPYKGHNISILYHHEEASFVSAEREGETSTRLTIFPSYTPFLRSLLPPYFLHFHSLPFPTFLLTILSVLPTAHCTMTATLLTCYASCPTGMFPLQYNHTFKAPHVSWITSLKYLPFEKAS